MKMEKTERKYAPFTITFKDPWIEEEEDGEVSLTFHFAKPTKLQIKRLQDRAAKDATQASRNLIFDVIQPEEKDGLLAAIEEYPAIVTSFSTAIMKCVGLSSDLGN